MNETDFDRLTSAYGRLHRDFDYLEEEYQLLAEQKMLLLQKAAELEERIQLLTEHNNRLSFALGALEQQYQLLLAQKEELARIQWESAWKASLPQEKDLPAALLEKDIAIWRLQLENERCRDELLRLQKEEK